MIQPSFRPIDTTWTRRLNLDKNKCFVCECPRCSDPAELGAHSSSILCFDRKGCDGVMMPLDTLNMHTDWRCDKCDKEVTADQVKDMMRELEREAEGFRKDDVNRLKSLIKFYSTRLHRNHTLLVELKQFLVSALGRVPGHTMEELGEADLRLKLLLCQQLLSVLDLVSPGLSLGRGLILFELHSVLVMIANTDYASSHDT